MKGARISHSAGKICCSDLVINLFPGLVTAETLDPGSATGDKRIPARGNMFPLSRQGAAAALEAAGTVQDRVPYS